MKKIILPSFALAGIVALTGCMTGNNTQNSTGKTDFNYKVGTASYTTTEESYGYSDGQYGNGSVKTAVVAAVFDEKGKIIKVSVDEINSNIYFDNMGTLQNFAPGEVKSKRELGDTYGMKKYSGIGKEWYQQADSLEKWLEGKNISQLTGNDMAVANWMRSVTSGMTGTNSTRSTTSSGAGSAASSGQSSYTDSSSQWGTTAGPDATNTQVPDGQYTGWMDEDLKASVTIDTANIRRALEKAYKNAK